ncbi:MULTISPECIES: methyl-accepting chemotaxis protein [Dickeya]|uniref:Methyl-accepting chemotaxis protein I (Serine chemoreceptor protein) n=1 Tax=Dickeya aquatica TaxID=1401087 RepID=A0A375AED5_9GAMM|nr:MULTISPECIES: methyl-accepting chemotaxis protein [Dickeya]SLM63949.1 Methyl-accepting chemotaxis protein I (serine chemoreceptor protein) [Dickeya aquatica]
MRVSLARKLWFPLVISLFFLAGALLYGSVKIKQDQLSLRENELMHVTQLALSIVKTQADQANAGAISQQEAQRRAMDTIKGLRYGEAGYFTILNSQARVLMHPINASLIGQGENYKDSNGVYLFRDMVTVTQDNQSGYTAYAFPRPGAATPQPKIAYNIRYAPWDWIITTGLYVDDIDVAFYHSLYQNAIVFILVSLAVLAFAYYINRSICRTLGGEPTYAADVAAKIASGDLSVSINTLPGDSMSLLHEMALMRERLTSVITDIRTGAQAINASSDDIVAGNMDLSSRMDLQAASLEKTSSSMEEITATVQQNADNAEQARQLVYSALDIASRGGTVMREVNDTMSGISESSDKIASITEVVNNIAFQTNILALNAAVEAARAGEQGRGFAVVAGEVRNLALRSAQAAKEIKTLIEESVSRVNSGSVKIKVADNNMNDVVSAVQRVAALMAEISTATAEQSKGIGLINESVIQIDAITQQNTALVQQAVAVAQALETQAQRLTASVAYFNTEMNDNNALIYKAS